MKKFNILLIGLLYLLGFSACNPTLKNIRSPALTPDGSPTLTVLSYNIRIGAGLTAYGESPYKLKDEVTLDLKPIIHAIASVDPDIVALQEVYGVKQAREIGESLGLNYAYIPHGIDSYGVWWGVATLSKFPIRKAKRQEISDGRGNTRSNLIAEIHAYGEDIIVTNIHKDKDLKDGESLRKTISIINKSQKPNILVGDLNIKPTYKRYSILTNSLLDTATQLNTQKAQFIQKRGTYPGENLKQWGKRIDYIFIDKKHFKTLDIGLLDKKHWPASDHLGYFAKLKLIK